MLLIKAVQDPHAVFLDVYSEKKLKNCHVNRSSHFCSKYLELHNSEVNPIQEIYKNEQIIFYKTVPSDFSQFCRLLHLTYLQY